MHRTLRSLAVFSLPVVWAPLLASVVLGVAPLASQEKNHEKNHEKSHETSASREARPHEREIRLAMPGGSLSLLKLSRALLDEYGYSGADLHFKDVKLNVRGAKGSLMLLGMSRALGGMARFRKAEGDSVLVIRIDPMQVRLKRHRFKQRMGRWLGVLVGRDVLARRYDLEVPDGLDPRGALVLCVHGLDSSARAFDDLRRFLSRPQAGQAIRSGTFTYANDEAVDRIAEALSARLRARAKAFPAQRIILVAHSMGGLVSRYMLETPALDPGNVTTLIMLGVPNHGSRLSRLRGGADVLEFLRDQGDKPRVLAPLFDGLGEAGWDLWPESPFLAALNAKPRNAAVTYRSILGSRGAMTREELAAWRSKALRTVRRMKRSEIYEKKIAAWLHDLDEVVIGAGDGAVSIARGKLEGVKEVVVPMSHIGMLDAAPRGREQPVFRQVRLWIEHALRRPR